MLAVYALYAVLTVGLRWVIYLGVEVFNITDEDLTYKFLWKPFDKPSSNTALIFCNVITDAIKIISTVLAQLLALIFPSTSLCFIVLSKKLSPRNTAVISPNQAPQFSSDSSGCNYNSDQPTDDPPATGAFTKSQRLSGRNSASIAPEPDRGLVVQKISGDSSSVDDNYDSRLVSQRQLGIDHSINRIDDQASQLFHRQSSISISSSISSSVSSRISSNDDEDEDIQLALPMQSSISISSSISSNDDEDEGTQLALPRQPSISISSSISSNDDEDEGMQLALPRQSSISILRIISSNDDEDEGMQLALPRQTSIENRLAAWELMHKPENVPSNLFSDGLGYHLDSLGMVNNP